MRQSLKLLMATTALVGFAMSANATSPNNIYIDATDNSGSVSSISITQDATAGADNMVAGNVGGTTAFPIAGALGNLAVTQTGSGNKLHGAITVNPASGTAGDLTAHYTSGANGTNTHSLTIGNSAAPASIGGATYSSGWTTTGPLSITMDATSGSASGNNAVTDILNTSGALNYTLNVAGTANTVQNTVTGSSIKLNVDAQGDSNSVTNSITNAGAVAVAVKLAGSSNQVTNNSTGSGAKTVIVQLASDGNTVDNELGSGGGSQTSTLVADASSTINYALTQNTAGGTTAAHATLYGVTGVSAVDSQAQILVTQADSATMNLTLYGNGNTFGPTAYDSGTSTYTGGLSALGTSPGQYSVVVAQSTGANLNANVTANAAGFTAAFLQ